MLKYYLGLVLVLLLAPPIEAKTASAKAGGEASLVFSSSVYGETEPCG